MRKMRRLLAFVLAVMMIMSNTVTASATSASSLPSGTVIDAQTDGDEVIVTTSEESDEEEIVSSSSDEEKEGEEEVGSAEVEASEPSGEDGDVTEPSTGDATEPGNGDATEPSTGEVTTTTSSEEESETVAATETTTEELTTEEETTTEELTTEEETTTEELTTEELLPEAPVLKATVGDTTQEAGENVRLIYGENVYLNPDSVDHYYFETIGQAVDEVDRLAAENPDWVNAESSYRFQIDLVDSIDDTEPSFTVSGDDMVTETEIGEKCFIYSNGYDITLTDANGTTVKTDVIIDGSMKDGSTDYGKILVDSGVTFQVLAANYPQEGYSFGTHIINTAIEYEDSNPTLIIGDPDREQLEGYTAQGIYFNGVDLPSDINIEIYDAFTAMVPEAGWEFDSLKIVPDVWHVDGFHNSESVYFLPIGTGGITANLIEVDTMAGFEVPIIANTLRLKGNSELNLAETADVKKIETVADSEGYSGTEIILTQYYELENPEDSGSTYVLKKQGRLNISESLVLDDAGFPICLRRSFVNGNNSEYVFEVGDEIGTMPAGVTTDMFEVYGMALGFKDVDGANTLYVQGEYVFGVTEGVNKWDYSGEMYKVATLEEAEAYIKSDATPVTNYWIHLLKDVDLSEDIDFSDMSDKIVGINLDYYNLNVTEDVSIQAAALDNGYVNIAKDKTLTFLSSGNTKSNNVNFEETQFIFAEDATTGGIVIGEEGQSDEISVYVPYNIYNSNQTSFTNSKNVNLSVYGSVEYMYNVASMYMAGFIDETELKALALDFNTIEVKGENDGSAYMEVFNAGVPVTATTLDLAGRFEPYSLNVGSVTAVTGSDIFLRGGESEIAGITLTQAENVHSNLLGIAIIETYENGTNDSVGKGSVTFSGTLNNAENTYVSLWKIANNLIVRSYDNIQTSCNDAKSAFADGEIVAMIDATNGNEAIRTVANYNVEYKTGSPLYLDMQETDEENIFNLTARKDHNDIRVNNTNTGMSRGFTTLADAKDYIYGLADATADYEIQLNKDITLSIDDALTDVQNAPLYYADNTDDQPVANSVTFNLNGHTITLNDTFGIHVNGMFDGQIKMGKAGLTLPIQDRAIWRAPQEEGGEGFWEHSWISDVKVTAHTGGTILRLAETAPDAPESENHVSLDNVTFAGELSEVWVADSAEIKGSITTKYLNAENGWLTANNLTVSNEAVVNTAYGLSVAPGGKVTIKNLRIVTPHNEDGSLVEEYAAYRVNLQQGLKADGTVKDKTGSFNLTGAITTDEGMKNALSMGKEVFTYVENTDNEGNVIGGWYNFNCQEEFTDGDIVATATNASVTAKYFAIDGDGRCTVKSGNNIKADTIELLVRYDGYQDGENWVDGGIEALYTSLEDAVKNMPTDFGKAEGNYTFTFMNDEPLKLTANVTMPSFVATLNLSTEEVGHEEEVTDGSGNVITDEYGNPKTEWVSDGVWYQRTLDLNGKTLTTVADIQMNEGVRVISSAAMGKIVTTADDCALNINANRPLANADGSALEVRDRILDNVLFTAKNGHVNLNCSDEDGNVNGQDNFLAASFDVLRFQVECGRWIIEDNSEKSKNYITTFEWWNGEESYFSVNQLTITGGNSSIDGQVEASNLSLSNSARLEVGGHLEVEGALKMAASKLLIRNDEECYGNVVIGTLSVSSAYASDAMGDYTVENHANFAANNISVSAGTFCNYGIVEAPTVTVKDFDNARDDRGCGQLICNTFVNTGKLYLGDDTHLMINKSGILNNVNVGDRYGSEGFALIGRSSDATVTFKGTFTKNGEDQQLLGFVTDEYKTVTETEEATGEESVVQTVFGNTFINGEGYEEYQWDWITLSDDNNTPDDYEDDFDASHVIALGEDDVLFNTEIKSFPVASIRVLPWTVPEIVDGESTGVRFDNINNAVYQDGKELKITGEYITIYAGYADGGYNIGTPLASFTTWREASAYLNTLNNPSMSYFVMVSKDRLEIGGKLELPKNVGQIIIASGIGEPVTLSYQGDITLNTDTGFENVILDAYTLDKKGNVVPEYNSTITANGKYLVFWNVQIADGKLKAIKGNASTQIDVNHSGIKVATKMSGIGELNLYDGATLEVEGGLSVNNLYTGFHVENGAPELVVVTGASSVLEVKNTLEMDVPTTLDSTGSIKLNEVLSNTAGNTLRTANANKITISGRVLSGNMDEAWNKVDVVADTKTVEDQEVSGYRYVEDDEDLTGKTTDQVIPFAVILSASDNTDGTVLATAEKVSPIWFVVESDDADYAFKDFTRKEGKNIVSGANSSENVVLSVDMGDGTEVMNTFDTLQEAFTEIDKIASPSMNYVIELKTLIDEETGDELPYTLLNSKGAVADYTFPKQAAEVVIRPQGDTPITVLYNKNMALKSNVTFENIDLQANVKGGTMSLGNFTLIMDNSAFAMDEGITFNVSGSGTTKGSKLVLKDWTQGAICINGNLSNVDTVVLNNSNLEVTGSTTIGNLSMKDVEIFTSAGAISIINVYTWGENFATIETAPKLSFNTKKVVTKVTPNLTISGEAEGNLAIDLYKGKLSDDIWEPLTLDEVETPGIVDVADGAGIAFAKAVNVNTEMISLSLAEEYGTVYKKAGNLVYKNSQPQVVLSYEGEPDEEGNTEDVITVCETFADAVTEINNLKTKRDYYITFVDIDADTAKQNPITFSMPNAKYVNTLVLSSGKIEVDAEANSEYVVPMEIYFTGNITLTSNVIISNLHFEQVAKNADKVYQEIDIIKDDANTYASPVTVKVNGAYSLDFVGDVTFNTPINLDGAGKAALNVHSDAQMIAEPVNTDHALTYADTSSENYWSIQGSVKNFAQVNVTDETDLYVSGYSSGKLTAPVYKAGELNVTELNVSDYSNVIVGWENVITDKVTVKNLNITDGSLTSRGNMALTNVTLSETAEVAAYGKTFNITGTLTSATTDATLLTALNAKQEAALNISGNVVLEYSENKINVKVVADLDETDGIVDFEEEIKLGSDEVTVLVNKKSAQKTIKAKLLTAKNADALMFLADDKSVGGTETLVVGAYDKTNNPDGYILKKVGSDMMVYYGDEVGAALYDVTNGYELYNYYPTVNDAVAAIDALKNKTASYRIELLQDVGGWNEDTQKEEYVKLSMPKYAENVVFASDMTDYNTEDGEIPISKKLYYSNDLTLSTNVVFKDVGLVPQEVRGVPKGINVKGYKLTLDEVFATATTRLGKIDGGGKDSTVTIIGMDAVQIAGDLVNVTNYIQKAINVIVNGKVTITNLTLENTEEGIGGVFQTGTGAATITNITNEDNGHQNSIYYRQDSKKNPLLTIKGEVTNVGINDEKLQLVLFREEGVVRIENTTTVKLNNVSKLATIEKAALRDLEFVISSGTTNTALVSEEVVWANKAAYIVEINNENMVTLQDESGKDIANYLDFSQAVNYINALADKEESYTIGVRNSITDTNLTDKYGYGKSSLSMPGKDKAEAIVVDGDDCNIHFSGDVTTYGDVKFENVWLYNTADFTITSKKNSDIKKPEYIEGKSALTLDHVTVELTDAGKGKIKNIAGEKKALDLTIMYSDLDLSGGVSNVDTLSVVGEEYRGDDLFTTRLTTRAKSDVTTLKLAAGGEWNAFGAATIGSIDSSEQNANSYIATSHSLNNKKQSTGNPQLTITGSVSNPVKVKVFEGVDLTELASYENQKLVIAKTESADKFISSEYAADTLVDGGFVYKDDVSVSAYKDKGNYVYNGNIENMEVLLNEVTLEKDEDGNVVGKSVGADTYAKTYADAITIINNIGDKTAHYQITLRNTEKNAGIIKTAVKNDEAVYGALALPAVNKAASLTIVGEDINESGENIQIHYTGSLSPKCDLNLENITLTEGKVDKKGIFTALNYITPNYSGVTVAFGEDVKTLDAAVPADFAMEGETPDLVFSKLTVNNSGKVSGILDITGHTVYVNGEIKVADVVTASGEGNEAVLASKGMITIEDIIGDGFLLVHTAYTNKAWQKAATQFTINGEMDSAAHLTILQYFCDTNEDGEKEYQILDGERARELFYDGYGKPASWQKVITAPKLQIQQFEDDKQIHFAALNIAGEDYRTVKYEGGVYLTNSQPSIEVSGYDGMNQAYTGYFFTWDQAVKEIDKLNHKEWTYFITLLEDIGSYGEPIKTLTMPSKAAEVIIDNEEDYYQETDGNGDPILVEDVNNVEGILMTGTSVALKTKTQIQVPIVAVKKSAGNFYPVAYTMNVGNYALSLNEMPSGVDIDDTGWFEATMKLNGSAKGSVEITPADTEGGGIYTNMITQIKGIGSVYLWANYDAYVNVAEEGATEDWRMKSVCFNVAEGISGVGTLTIDQAVRVESKDKDVSVKNLIMGEPKEAPEDAENLDHLYEGNDCRGELTAKNITVSDTLTMASAGIKAGTSKSGDGKVTLNNVFFRDYCNNIEGKQDAKGNSLIQIKGNVSAQECMCASDSAVTIGLYYNNTSQKYVRLSEGMTLLTAPKAASSWFRPNYDWYDETTGEGQSNMGPEVSTEVSRYDENGVVVKRDEQDNLVTGENGNLEAETTWASLYNLYKSGNVIKYGHTGNVVDGIETVTIDGQEYKVNVRWIQDIAEARLWVGTDTMEDTHNASAYDFMTFEEAVKAIDSMNLKAADGKTSQTYCIELLNDVEIGNEKGNNKYSALSLPSKASNVTIWGNGRSITFTGNVTLRCNTTFRDVCFMPVKLVKNELVPAEVNLAAGNFKLTWHWSNVLEGKDEEGNWIWSEEFGFANVTGSSKGELIIAEDSFLKANNISGFKAVRFVGNGEFYREYQVCDENGNPVLDEENNEVWDISYGQLLTTGNITIQELHYENLSAGILRVRGNLATNVIYMTGKNLAYIWRLEDKVMKVNGTTLSVKDEETNKIVKIPESVVYTDDNDPRIFVITVPTKTLAVSPGTKILSGKNLDAADWNLESYSFDEGGNISGEHSHNAYVTGNDLFIGTEVFNG